MLRQIHNVEIDAYRLFNAMPNFPMPRLFYADQADDTNLGRLAMQDMGSKTGVLPIWQSANERQILNTAIVLANLQVEAN